MRDYCQRTQEHWSVCKRFIIKNELGTCPDFVLPDTTLSLPEIIAKFDEQQD